MKNKKTLIYSLAFIIFLVCWWINISTKAATQGITGATVAEQPPIGILGYIQLIVLVLFFFAAVLAQKYEKPYLKYSILIFAILFLGFYKKTMLTTGHILNLVSGKFWPLAGHIFIYTLLFLVLLSCLLGKNIYCNYCCPFGAVQQVIYKTSPFKQEFNPYLIALFRRFRYLFLWLVLVLALLLDNFRIARLDPFYTTFSLQGNWLAWIQLGLILGFSLLYYRVWCFHFCPVGAALHIIGKIPRIKTVFSKKAVSIEKTAGINMFKKHTTYIFLITFLILLIVTLSIVIINLKKQIQEPGMNFITPAAEDTTKKDSSIEEFTKQGIKPKEALYYE